MLEVVIEKVVPGGDGLARVDGRVLLVSGGLTGDRVRVEITKETERLLQGRVVEVLAPGPARRDAASVCPHAASGACGGCDWPAALLSSHGELKTALVLDALTRIGRLRDLPEPRFVESPPSYRLRNRLHVDAQGRVGFYAPRSNDVCDIETCEIVSPPFLARLPAIRAAAQSLNGTAAELLTLEGRDGTPLLGQLEVAGEVADAKRLADAFHGPLDGVRVVGPGGRLLASPGPSSLTIAAGGAGFRVSVTSFFQGNRHLLDVFQTEVRSMVDAGLAGKKAPSAADLFAGVGFLTWPLIEAGARATAVEIDTSSSSDLTANVAAWGRGKAVRSTAESFLRDVRGGFDLFVLDPPRAGLSPEVRKALLRLAPPSLLMVSCDPATLARDLAALASRYRPEQLVLLDLFPQTHHVETLVLLKRTG